MSYYDDISYASNRTGEYSTENATAHESGHTVRDDADRVEPFDLLSLLSVVTTCDAQDYASEVLLSIYLGPWRMFVPITPYRGAFFSVTLVTRQDLFRRTAVGLDSRHPISKMVALKTPILDENLHSLRNSRLFRSIAKEYQILKSESLRNHENIVTLFGCCWQTIDIHTGLPVPSLILEGTVLGDLEQFSTTRELTLRKRLGICIDIASGLQAIHALGIVHGDLKPQNILIFHSQTREYIAKIADFGSSIFLVETSLPARPPTGTPLFSAPECSENAATLNREELFKTDIFSLGIVLMALIYGMYILGEMKTILSPTLVSLKKSGSFEKWIIELSSQELRDAVNQTHPESIEHDDEWEIDTRWSDNSVLEDESLWAMSLFLLKGTLAAISVERVGSVEDVLSVLRTMLRLHLRRLFEKRGSSRHNSSSKSPSPEWWARMSSVLRMSKSRMRKLTGAQIETSDRLNQQEIEAIALSCLIGPESGNPLRESQFIRKHNTNKRAYQSVGHRSHTSLTPKLGGILTAWIQQKLIKWTELKPTSMDKTIFKVSRHSQLLGMLPYNVKELLEAQLQQEAMSKSNTATHRADAAYEYANMVFRSAELNLSTPRVANALDLLAQSANNGHLEAQATVGSLHDALGYSVPVRREVEIEWLFAGSLRGSMTAQTRLKKLDAEKYKEAIVLIGSSYGGLSPEVSGLLHDQNLLNALSDDPSQFPVGYIHYLASIGDLELLIKSPRLPKEMYNLRNILGETPLVVACRAGHAKVATFLLQCGSDPSISTNQGVCPLHFLSAFDEQSIPTMATLLLQYGAVLEQPSRNAKIYMGQFDSRFGSVNGTPLLWAVAARNASATEALVEHGADPFKTTTEQIRAFDEDDRWEPSPIQWAALWHQHQLLKILLSGAKRPQDRIALQQRLNTTFFRCHDAYQSALYAALDCNPTFRFHELLLHGINYERAALKCVRLLVKYGADPNILSRDWNNQSDNPMAAACQGGSLLLIKYLWQYNNGSLRPTPKIWLDCVTGAIFSHNRSVFDFLFEHREDIASDYAADKAAVGKILVITEDQYFALASLKLVLKPPCAHRSTELVELFEAAIWAGHFEAAKRLFQEGGLSLTSRIDGNTFLGNLILMSSSYPNIDRKISFFLSVPPKTDELFWNVSYLAGSGLTALEAVVCTQNHGSCMNAGVFNIILEHFNDPKYLNSQVKGKTGWKYTGYSVLHLAVEHNNPDAVWILLDKAGIDPNLLNSRGESPTDLCIVRNQTLSKRLDREFPARAPSIHREKETNIMVLNNLLSAGGRISNFYAIIRRSSENTFDVIHRISGRITSLHLYDKIETSGLAISKPSRSLVLQIPIGGLIPFVDTISRSYIRLPIDLDRLIFSIRREYSSAD
ncbi:uncharacterized protein PAC_15971 [Phialocephala subalpina]|uniref:non-specific serine/threonine protein kinase n=1 Tax=Phialocephala subalpina TaxID=576137 RepID=A0A1L7XLY3_9HELO|nr:uncharacterized protein PAC_15971 [Phialocephala subalpina]